MIVYDTINLKLALLILYFLLFILINHSASNVFNTIHNKNIFIYNKFTL